jgi:hypothetical protein
MRRLRRADPVMLLAGVIIAAVFVAWMLSLVLVGGGD